MSDTATYRLRFYKFETVDGYSKATDSQWFDLENVTQLTASLVGEMIDRSQSEWRFLHSDNVSELLFCGYTRAELEDAFDKVKHPDDWKEGNRAYVELGEMDVTEAAIRFYTGGSPYYEELQPTGRYMICFYGYYHHIGS